MSPVVPILVFLAIAIFLGVLSWRQAAKRRAALTAWAKAQGLAFRPERDKGLEQRFPLHDCLRQGSNRYAENLLEGERGGRKVCLFDYHYETYSTDSKGHRQTHHHRFSMAVVDSALPLKPLSLRPEGFFDRFLEAVGWDDIDFELAEFSRAFYVKATDRKWAFDVFPQKTMEFLLGAPRFTVEMAGPWVLVRKGSLGSAEDFAGALAVAEGILERLPGYVVRELKGEER